MDFVTKLPISTNWKSNSYNLILVIVDRLIIIVHYKLAKIIINDSDLAKVIIDVIVQDYDLPNLVVSDWSLIFILKFWSSIYYFLKIKRRLSAASYSQINGQIKKQNSTIEAYLRIFINYKLNNKAKLLLITEFAYNNIKNANTSYIQLRLSLLYFLKKDINLYFKLI